MTYECACSYSNVLCVCDLWMRMSFLKWCTQVSGGVPRDSCIYVTWCIHMCVLLCFIKSILGSHGPGTWSRRIIQKESLSHISRASQGCDMTHSCVRHDSFKCVTWLLRMCGVTYVDCVTWRKGVTWRMHDMVHAYMWCDPLLFALATRESGACVCQFTTWYVWHCAFMCVTWLTLYVNLFWDPATREQGAFVWMCYWKCVKKRIHMCEMTYFVVYVFVWSCYARTGRTCVNVPLVVCDIAHAYVWHDLSCTMMYLYDPATRAQGAVVLHIYLICLDLCIILPCEKKVLLCDITCFVW